MKVLLATLLLVLAVYAKEEFRGDKVYRITPKNDAQVEFLKQWIAGDDELDVWVDPSHPGHNADIHVHNGDCAAVEAMLKENGIEFEEMVHDVQDLLEEEEISNQQHAFAFGYDYSRYNNWNNIKYELQNLAARYSNRASLFNVGRTYEGRDMVGIKITNGDGRSKPVHWIDGGIHAREWISPATVMYFMNKLLTSSDSRVTEVLSKYDFYILPVFNIDGYEYTQRGGRARIWRKTRRPTGRCYGADPNRNWDSHFGGAGTSSNPCSDIYHGGRAFSEIEVKNVANYLRRLNLKSYWNVHAYSQMVLTPWSYTTRLPRDYTEIRRVADVFVSAVRQKYGTYYRAGSPPQLLYAVAGGSIDWTYEKLGVKYSYALELRDKGQYGFILPASQIKPSGEETSDAFFAAIKAMK